MNGAMKGVMNGAMLRAVDWRRFSFECQLRIKTKLNRVVYRSTLVRAFNQRAGKRRRVINQREYRFLDFLLKETEPVDPFAEEPSLKIAYSELRQAPYVRGVYRNVKPRTFHRELTRLAEMGFIRFLVRQPEPTIEIDFGAIGKY